jgi:hypothetical protein
MIDPTRRHGHFDTRWQIDPAPVRASATFSAPASDDSPWIQDWENEGGRSTARERPMEEAREGALGWSAFATRYFPGTRRHDFAAVSAYAAYLAHLGGRDPRAALHASSSLDINAAVAPR